jgi:hypothetical protein
MLKVEGNTHSSFKYKQYALERMNLISFKWFHLYRKAGRLLYSLIIIQLTDVFLSIPSTSRLKFNT